MRPAVSGSAERSVEKNWKWFPTWPWSKKRNLASVAHHPTRLILWLIVGMTRAPNRFVVYWKVLTSVCHLWHNPRYPKLGYLTDFTPLFVPSVMQSGLKLQGFLVPRFVRTFSRRMISSHQMQNGFLWAPYGRFMHGKKFDGRSMVRKTGTLGSTNRPFPSIEQNSVRCTKVFHTVFNMADAFARKSQGSTRR